MTSSTPTFCVHDTGKIYGFFGNFRFLSNFYILDNGVYLDGLYYPCVENAYQAAKWEPIDRYQFVEISPQQAKSLGKKSKTLNLKKWNRVKRNLMEGLVRQKFQNNNKLYHKLALLDGYELQERNIWGDVYWGTNINGDGENNLGKILMKIRDEILKELKE